MHIHPMIEFTPTNIIKQHVIDNRSYILYEKLSIDKFTLMNLEYEDNQIKYGKCKIEGHLCDIDINDGIKFDCLGDTNEGWYNIGIENYCNYEISRHKSVEEFLNELNNIFNSYKNKSKNKENLIDKKNNISEFEIDIQDMKKDIAYIKNTISEIYQKIRNSNI